MTIDMHIDIDISQQKLTLLDKNNIRLRYSVSTAKNGSGEKKGSECTPRGWHSIRAKIGTDAMKNTVFIARRTTGELYTPELRASEPQRDWILTRILWLSGQEKGKNRGGQVDTMQRYIYIHGCPDDDSFALPSSHGCIKMRNDDIITLYHSINPGIRVFIHE